jgi:hypothetical protein
LKPRKCRDLDSSAEISVVFVFPNIGKRSGTRKWDDAFCAGFLLRAVLTVVKNKVSCRPCIQRGVKRTPGNLTTKGAPALQKAMRPARGKLTFNRISRFFSDYRLETKKGEKS